MCCFHLPGFCELVTLIFFLVILTHCPGSAQVWVSTGLVRKEGPCSFLKNCHHVTIAPPLLCIYFSSDFLREPLKVVLHITDLIFHQADSAVNISWDIVRILVASGVPRISLISSHLFLYIFHQGICSSAASLLLTFCSVFIKVSHSSSCIHMWDRTSIPKFSSGSKETLFRDPVIL